MIVSTSCLMNAFVHRSNQARISFVAASSGFAGTAFFLSASALTAANAIKTTINNVNCFMLVFFDQIVRDRRRKRDGKFPTSGFIVRFVVMAVRSTFYVNVSLLTT